MSVMVDAKPSFWIAVRDHFFTDLFALEAMVLFYRNGIRGYFADPGRRLDFFLVCLSIADVWILAQIDLKADMNGFMAIRCLRLMRVIRLVRVFSVKKELNVFICFVIGALRAWKKWIKHRGKLWLFSLAYISYTGEECIGRLSLS